jgi:hypothetical protein
VWSSSGSSRDDVFARPVANRGFGGADLQDMNCDVSTTTNRACLYVSLSNSAARVCKCHILALHFLRHARLNAVCGPLAVAP